MGRILRLDPIVSSQIAAGEVVERPSSVVKELVENSLDAGARRIFVEVDEAGLGLISVSDDGSGMSHEDARLSVERFATSKIVKTSDLQTISSLGFRGEALPSIASCSRLTLVSRTEGDSVGISISVEVGVVTAEKEVGTPVGTTITVRDLFYNTPARLRFTKTRTGERQAVIDTVMRLCLSWPDVQFTLRSLGKTVLTTAGTGLSNAVSDLFGADEASRYAQVDESFGNITLTGLVGKPSACRRRRDRQYFSVNKRPVRNMNLSWALDSAFAGLIPPKTYPAAILNITVAPDDVDANIHPTKAEVKFRDEAQMRRAVGRAVGAAVGITTTPTPNSPEARHMPLPAGHTPFPPGRTPSQARHAPSQGRREALGPSMSWGILRDGIAQPAPSGRQEPLMTHPSDGGFVYLGSLSDTYLIATQESSLVIIDKHALMESLAYAELLGQKSGQQELLLSEVLRLDPSEAAVYEEYQEALLEMGYGSRFVGDKTVLVNAVPVVSGRELAPGSLKEVLAKLGSGYQAGASPERLLEAARLETAACHASVRAREPLSPEEAVHLLRALEKHPEARTCPHGRPCVKWLSGREVAAFFGRRPEVGGGS